MYVGIKFELQVIEMYDWGDAFEKMTPDIEVIYAFRQKGLPRCVNRNFSTVPNWDRKATSILFGFYLENQHSECELSSGAKKSTV